MMTFQSEIDGYANPMRIAGLIFLSSSLLCRTFGQAPAQLIWTRNVGLFSTLYVTSTPDGADVTIGDESLGKTPLSFRLAAGSYRIKLERSGYKPWRETLIVYDAGRVSVYARLERD
jgi:hypothetical protein